MHTCVMLFTSTQPDSSEIDEIIEPFYEGLEVEPQLEGTYGPEDITELREKEGVDEWANLTDAEFLDEWTQCYGLEAPVAAGDGTFDIYDSRNPDGMWDWCEIGGRYSDVLPGGVTSAKLEDLDFAGVARAQMQDDAAAFAAYQEQAEALPGVPGECELVDDRRLRLAHSILGEGLLTPKHRIDSVINSTTVEEFLAKQTYEFIPYGFIDLAGSYFDHHRYPDDYDARYLRLRDSLPGTTWVTALDWHR